MFHRIFKLQFFGGFNIIFHENNKNYKDFHEIIVKLNKFSEANKKVSVNNH